MTNEPNAETCVNCARLKPRNANDTALCQRCNQRFDFGEDEIGIDYFEKVEPTTGEIVRALKCENADCSGCKYCHEEPDFFTGETQQWCMDSDLHKDAADRLESQERDVETLRAFHERYAEQTSKKYVEEICALIARAEQAERERDAAVNALTLYEDALFDECDKSYQSGFMDGFQSREEIDDED